MWLPAFERFNNAEAFSRPGSWIPNEDPASAGQMCSAEATKAVHKKERNTSGFISIIVDLCNVVQLLAG